MISFADVAATTPVTIGVGAGALVISVIGAAWHLSKSISRKVDREDCLERHTSGDSNKVDHAECLSRQAEIKETLSAGDECMARLDERIKAIGATTEKQEKIAGRQERAISKLEGIIKKNGGG